MYRRDRSQPPLKLSCPIGFDGLYRKSEPTIAGVFATKGKWVNGSTLEVERRWVGMDELQKWTLSFDGDRLHLRGRDREGREVSVDSEPGGNSATETFPSIGPCRAGHNHATGTANARPSQQAAIVAIAEAEIGRGRPSITPRRSQMKTWMPPVRVYTLPSVSIFMPSAPGSPVARPRPAVGQRPVGSDVEGADVLAFGCRS